jgi:hypothetical protein
MRRPRNRARKLVVTDELVELFRVALPGEVRWWDAAIAGREVPEDQRQQDHAAALAFDVAVGRKPWELPLLDPDAGGELQAALLAKLYASEIKEWRRFASRRRGYLDRQAIKHAKEYQARVARSQGRPAGG